jgi:hypothetical protein
MTTVIQTAALVVTAAGLVAAAGALARTRKIPLSLALLLDFFTAASLLRLAGSPTWPALGTAALTIVIRQLASRGLRAAQGLGALGVIPDRLRSPAVRPSFRRR